MSVNAFRALERIILHLVRLVLHYFAHNIAHIACFSIILLFYRSVIRSSYISSSAFMHVYRISYIYRRPSPFVGIRQIFAPFARKKKVRIESCSRQVVCSKKLCWKQLLSSYFHPFEPFAYRIATTSSCFSSHFSPWNASNCKSNVVTSYILAVQSGVIAKMLEMIEMYFQLVFANLIVSYKKTRRK